MELRTPKPTKNFTIIPNELLHSSLSNATRSTWLMIASVARDGYFNDGRGMAYVAELYGIPYTTFISRVQRLKAAGGLVGNQHKCELIIPGGTVEPVEEEVEEEEATIAEEIEVQPKRKPSGVTQKESMAQIKEAWNANKPEAFMLLDGKMHPSLFIAIETQAKRLGIERPDYGEFVGEVLRAAQVDPYWSVADMKPSRLFGWGTDIGDNKFRNVEKLYRSPVKAKVQVDYLDKDFWLSWYDGYKDLTDVEFKYADSYWDALDRVDEEVDPNTAYVWTKEGGKTPHHWTGRKDQTTRKFRDLP
jgi:hypothetical protein